MKKIISLLLSAATLFLLVSCSNGDEAPDGYKIASNSEACAYTLFVPENWVTSAGENKTDYTMATVANADRCNVSLSVVSDVESGATFEEFWAAQEAQYKALFPDGFTVEKTGETVKVGSLNGIRCIYTASFGGKQYKFMQVFVPRSTVFTAKLYAFTYTASLDKVEGKDVTHYDEHLETVNEILSYVNWD